jgi:8-oxo-dGTP pyrophosphatase MutT (NUDIX family)
VIPYRVRGGRVEVAVITSTNNGDWIVPKGGIEAGERAWEAAAREADEEAGLRGAVERTPLGRCYSSNGSGDAMAVFLLAVTTVLEHWPEDNVRRRRWLSLSEAAACLRPEFRPFVAMLEDRLGLRSEIPRDGPRIIATDPRPSSQGSGTRA